MAHLATATILILAGGLGLRNCGTPTRSVPSPEPNRGAAADSAAIGDPSGKEDDLRKPHSSREPKAVDPYREAVVAQLDRLISELRTSGDPEFAGVIRALLRDSVSDASIAAILAYLDGGKDVEIDAEFVVGSATFLDSAPTLRVLLLDLLGELDARVAAEYSGRIFGDSASADEWAVALRNYVAGHQLQSGDAAMADGYLTARVAEALANGQWQETPTVGFLHTLDFAVLAPDTGNVGALAALTAPDAAAVHPAVRRVANGQLWRMAHRDFAGTVARLEEADALDRLAPDCRAVLIAHADLRDEGGRKVIEGYLSTELPEAELERFAEVFPYHGLEVTNHLATQNERGDMADDADSVIEAYRVVQEWRRDQTFPGKDAALGRIEARLERLGMSIARGLEQP